MAMLVSQQLNLNMLHWVQILLHIHPAVPEGVLSLRGGSAESPLQILGPLHNADALAAPPGAGLEHHWIADFFRGLNSCLRVREDICARRGGNAALLHQPAGSLFVAHLPNHLGRRADKYNAVLPAQGGKLGILR